MSLLSAFCLLWSSETNDFFSESESEWIPPLTMSHGYLPWSHQHCRGETFGSCLFSLASFCSLVLPICLHLHWMSDVLLSSEGWKETPGPVSWPLCVWWCQPPVISVLSLHLFHLPPLLCLCLMVPVSATGCRPGESHPRVLIIQAMVIVALWMWF